MKTAPRLWSCRSAEPAMVRRLVTLSSLLVLSSAHVQELPQLFMTILPVFTGSAAPPGPAPAEPSAPSSDPAEPQPDPPQTDPRHADPDPAMPAGTSAPDLMTVLPPLTDRPADMSTLEIITTVPPLTSDPSGTPLTDQAATCTRLPDLAPTPVEVVMPRSKADAVIKVDADGRVYVRGEDAAVFGLPRTCAAPGYLPVTWAAAFHPDTLTVTVTPPADHYGARVENAAAPSPDLPAATVAVQTAVASDALTPLRAAVAVQGEAQTGTVRVSGAVDAEVHTQPGAAARPHLSGRATVGAASVAVQRGDVTLEGGLVNVGRPLLGVAIGRAPAGPVRPPLRVQTATGGPYILQDGPRVLRQGYLEPGITDLDDLELPGGEYVLTLTIDEAGTRRVVPLPYHAPAAVPVGTLSYRVAAGARPAHTSMAVGQALPAQAVAPAFDVQGRAQVSADASVRARASLWSDPELSVGADLRPTPTSQASVEARVRRDTAARTTGVDASAALSVQADWGTWSTGVAIGYAQPDGTQGTARLDVTAGATVQGVNVQVGTGVHGTAPYGRVGVSGTFERGHWNVQGSAEPGRARVDLSVTLRPTDGWQLTGGVIGGHAQLAARRDVDTRRWTEDRQLPPMQAAVTTRVLPTPGVTVDVNGPVSGSASVSFPAGAGRPTLNLTAGARWGVTGGRATLVAPVPGRLLVVRVGVPGVRVGAGGFSAWTGPDGQAVLSMLGTGAGSVVTAQVDERTLPISATLSRTSLRVTGDGHALGWLADFTPYLERNALRRLTGRTFPQGSVAHAGGADAPVSAAGYFALPAQPGDPITVTWPGGACAATYGLAEELPCH